MPAAHNADVATVWLFDLASLTDADVARCGAVLSPAETDRMRRFHFPSDRLAYLAAHALARTALSALDDSTEPREWRFVETTNGRPEIAESINLQRLRFSISHTRGLVACIVTRDVTCGIDVESAVGILDLDGLARAVLARDEQAIFDATPEAQRKALFCRYWTLKEAYAKALGLGMSLRFDTIGFELGEGTARLTDAGGNWHFEHWTAGSGYNVAVAVRQRQQEVRVLRQLGFPPADHR